MQRTAVLVPKTLNVIHGHCLPSDEFVQVPHLPLKDILFKTTWTTQNPNKRILANERILINKSYWYVHTMHISRKYADNTYHTDIHLIRSSYHAHLTISTVQDIKAEPARSRQNSGFTVGIFIYSSTEYWYKCKNKYLRGVDTTSTHAGSYPLHAQLACHWRLKWKELSYIIYFTKLYTFFFLLIIARPQICWHFFITTWLILACKMVKLNERIKFPTSRATMLLAPGIIMRQTYVISSVVIPAYGIKIKWKSLFAHPMSTLLYTCWLGTPLEF